METTSKREQTRHHTVEYKFLRREYHSPVSKKRYLSAMYLGLFQALFIALFALFANYNVTKFTENSYSSNYLKIDSSFLVSKGRAHY